MKKFAVRNLRLCTKDCLCLYVCPTGAADTENSVIDRDKCIGCGACADACPGKAISMVPYEMPIQQKHESNVLAASKALTGNKATEENILRGLLAKAKDNNEKRLFEGLMKSTRLINEDAIREAGYMLPQSKNAHDLLESLIANPPTKDFPVEAAKNILNLIKCNE